MRPDQQGDTLDYIVLGTLRSPGTCKIIGADRTPKWDIKDAAGQVGASSSFKGMPLGEFEIEFFLADDGADPEGETDFDLWEIFQRLCESTINGPTPVALPIFHPDLARNRYTEVVLRSMGGAIYDNKGGRMHKVRFGEHKPPKSKPVSKATVKPAGRYAETEGDIGTGRRAVDPNEEAKRELASLLDEAKKP